MILGIGLPIGWSVGRGFRERFDHTSKTARTWTVAPLVAGDARGLSVVGTL